MSMPPEEFYGKSEPQKAERNDTGPHMIARMTSALVFLRTSLIGAFLAIVVIHLLGPSVGYAGNAYDLGGLLFGFALGTVIEWVRRNRGRKTAGTADRQSMS